MTNRRPIGAKDPPVNADGEDDLTRLIRTIARQAAQEAFNLVRDALEAPLAPAGSPCGPPELENRPENTATKANASPEPGERFFSVAEVAVRLNVSQKTVADETKSHVPYEVAAPSALAPRFDRYLDTHRLVLMRGERTDGAANAPPRNPGLDAVWVSENGSQLGSAGLWRTIVNHTKAAFGSSVSPHFFRDCAATSIAVDNPRYVGDASLVLGHAGHRMTEKHYNHARSLEAARRHAETLARLRRSLNRKRRG
jgi:hypothetical protein